jgi:magnesium-transporting ATPase (P-type)
MVPNVVMYAGMFGHGETTDARTDPILQRLLKARDENTINFFRALALCHTVVPQLQVPWKPPLFSIIFQFFCFFVQVFYLFTMILFVYNDFIFSSFGFHFSHFSAMEHTNIDRRHQMRKRLFALQRILV